LPALGNVWRRLERFEIDFDELFEQQFVSPLSFGLIGQQRIDRLGLAECADDGAATTLGGTRRTCRGGDRCRGDANGGGLRGGAATGLAVA
jgi:hypothetical protein